MEVGIDIEQVRRFKLPKKDKFLCDTFTEKELNYAFSKTNPSQSLCGFFCAKEALIKTLKNQAILPKDIEISHNKGRPKISLKKVKNKNVTLSISHCENYSVAIVLVK